MEKHYCLYFFPEKTFVGVVSLSLVKSPCHAVLTFSQSTFTSFSVSVPPTLRRSICSSRSPYILTSAIQRDYDFNSVSSFPTPGSVLHLKRFFYVLRDFLIPVVVVISYLSTLPYLNKNFRDIFIPYRYNCTVPYNPDQSRCSCTVRGTSTVLRFRQN